MANSKNWLALSPEQKTIKRKEYRDRYKAKHPDRIRAASKKFKEANKERLRITQSLSQKKRCQANKLKAIEYKGGKCFDCKNEYEQCCYDFHHINPLEKDLNIAQMAGRTFDGIKNELDKCVLLCSNCHRIRHFKEKN